MKKVLKNIFSIKNEYKNNIKRKIITILGLKISFKVKNKKPLTKKEVKNLLNYQKNNNELTIIDNDTNSKEKILHYSTYKIHCGIAQFLDDYIEGLNEAGYKNNAILPINHEYLKDKKLIFNYLNKFIKYSDSFDTVIIQHEYGFWKIKDFNYKNKKIDLNLFKINVENNENTYGLLLFDYLISELLKLNKKVKVIWHTDFEIALQYFENISFKQIPFFWEVLKF